MTINELYAERCRTPHNIDTHLPRLRALARRCDTVTEFGTDIGFSTTAFLAAAPYSVNSYDLVRTEWVDTLQRLAGLTGVDYQFHQEDTLTCPVIDYTDLLFVDSEHTYAQVKGELERHGHRVRRYLAFHDTISNPGIVPAIEEYTAVGWVLEYRADTQNGLWIYRRQEDWAL